MQKFIWRYLILNNMREIKIRFWSKLTMTMSPTMPLEQLLYQDHSGITKDLRAFSDKYVESMLSTNLLDKNGKEIIEGDLVKSESGDIYRVEYYILDGAYFIVRDWIEGESTEGMIARVGANALEVIGNIYENPALIGF